MAEAEAGGAPLRLHLGGKEAKEGWKILNIQPGPGVDFVGNVVDLSQFADASVAEVYASHVLEHLGYQEELPAALREIHRVLSPGGALRISVPDLPTLCRLYLDPRFGEPMRFHIMRMMFGGQVNAYDFHKVGLSWSMLEPFLTRLGFSRVERVEEHGLFKDASSIRVEGELISLNVVAVK